MIKTVEKPCPGDCSKCSYPNEIQNFDMYGCALNQSLQRGIRIEQRMKELAERVYRLECHVDKETVMVNNYKENDDGTSDEVLP